MTAIDIPNAKLLPLFEPTRLPTILDQNGVPTQGSFDLMTRAVFDASDMPVPPSRVLDPGHLRTRYYVYYGGRGGAKSHAFATAAILRAVESKVKILCCREIQSSMADSVLSLLVLKIEALGLKEHFEVLVNEIRCKLTGSTFAFRGLRHNINELKSFEDADICWVEEAADVTEESWDKLDPTIRKAGAEVWVGFNTDLATDPTYVKFVTEKDDDMTTVMVSWDENAMLDVMMRKQAMKLYQTNPQKARHIWGGEPRLTKEGGVFEVEMFGTIDVAPIGTVWVRGWDLAGTAVDPKKAKKKQDNGPDWTAGVLIGRQPNGRFVVGDASRMRGDPHKVETFLKNTMTADGAWIEQSIPQDPGQAGKHQVGYFAGAFAGYRLHFSTESGSKEVRAGGFASQVNAGNVDLVRGAWNKAYKEELAPFPDGGYFDDQVDASSRAFARLLMPRKHQRVKVRGL